MLGCTEFNHSYLKKSTNFLEKVADTSDSKYERLKYNTKGFLVYVYSNLGQDYAENINSYTYDLNKTVLAKPNESLSKADVECISFFCYLGQATYFEKLPRFCNHQN